MLGAGFVEEGLQARQLRRHSTEQLRWLRLNRGRVLQDLYMAFDPTATEYVIAHSARRRGDLFLAPRAAVPLRGDREAVAP